jgi:hypothetical protein
MAEKLAPDLRDGLGNFGEPKMSVSIRYIAAVTALTALSGAAYAGGCCGTNTGGGVVNVPPAPTYTAGGSGCCGPVTSHPIGVPGVFVPAPSVNVVVGGPQIGGTNVAVGGPTFIGGSSTTILGGGGGNTYIGGGGGFVGGAAATSPGIIERMNVGGGQEAESYQESRSVTETMAIRAVCMDDRGMPHPASRVDGDEQVAATFSGEMFRCMAGTRMEVTVGRMVNGQAVFDGGTALSCAKGQALSYSGGQLTCTAQIARAACNERSLLRRYGPGLKYVTLTRTETVTATRQREATWTSSMFVDGGVGQGVW